MNRVLEAITPYLKVSVGQIMLSNILWFKKNVVMWSLSPQRKSPLQFLRTTLFGGEAVLEIYSTLNAANCILPK